MQIPKAAGYALDRTLIGASHASLSLLGVWEEPHAGVAARSGVLEAAHHLGSSGCPGTARSLPERTDGAHFLPALSIGPEKVESVHSQGLASGSLRLIQVHCELA